MVEPILDIEQPLQLTQYLRDVVRIGDAEVTIRRLSGGVSNRAMLVTLGDGNGWVIKQALPKLRVAVDWFSDPARIEREGQGLRRLAELAPPGAITPFVFEDRQQHMLCMQAVPEPHDNWKSLLLAGKIDRHLVQQFGELLACIHRRAAEQRVLLEPEFADTSFFESLRLEPYYLYTAEQIPGAAAFLHRLVAETRGRRDTIVHGDYSPKNILVHAGQLVLLDHEVIHWGEPAFDLGFMLTHFLSKAHHLPAHRGALMAAVSNCWRTYQEVLGRVEWADDLEFRAVQHALACLLARVAGRSPLEYLSPAEKSRQTDIVLALMAHPPQQVEPLIEQFIQRIEEYESN